METLALNDDNLASLFKYRVAMMIRNSICQDANKTQLNPTPKSIKQAFGIAVSPHDANIKLFYEHQKDNY